MRAAARFANEAVRVFERDRPAIEAGKAMGMSPGTEVHAYALYDGATWVRDFPAVSDDAARAVVRRTVQNSREPGRREVREPRLFRRAPMDTVPRKGLEPVAIDTTTTQ